jgi:hypothetical protein
MRQSQQATTSTITHIKDNTIGCGLREFYRIVAEDWGPVVLSFGPDVYRLIVARDGFRSPGHTATAAVGSTDCFAGANAIRTTPNGDKHSRAT